MLELAGTIVLFFLSYLGLGLLIAPHGLRRRSASYLASAVILSFWSLYIPFGLLIRMRLLTGPAVILVLFLLLCAGVALFLRQRRLPSAESNHNGDRSSQPRWLLFALISVLLFHSLDLRHGAAVRGGFFYLSEIKHVIAAQGLPATVRHFDIETEPQVDKLGFTTLGAGIATASHGNYSILSTVGYLGSVLLAAAAAFGFFSGFMTPMFAAHAAIALFANLLFSWTPTVRSFYLPENVALIYLFASLTLFRNCYAETRENKRPLLLITGAGVAACLLNHLEIGLVLGLLSLALACVESIARKHIAPLKALMSCWTIAAVLLGVGYTILGVVPDFISPSARNESYSAFNGFDPTYEFLAPYGRHTPFSTSPIPHGLNELAAQLLRLQGIVWQQPGGAILMLSGLVVALFTVLLQSRKENSTSARPAIYTVALFIALICGLVVFTDHVFAIWVYQTEALRRISPYIAIGMVWIVYQLFDSLARIPRFRPIGVGVALLCTAGCFAHGLPLLAPLPSPFRLSADARELLHFLSQQAPGSVLSPEVTTGAFHVLAGHTAILEGHQPVLRPAMIQETLRLRETAKQFYRDPIGNISFLGNHHINYVIVGTAGGSTFAGTPLLPVAEQFTQWQTVNELCDATRFGELTLYRVCS